MTIKLITGIPGSGKTLFAVSELKKCIEQNTTSDEPRNIYCDITGLKVSDIKPPPLDWRTTPPKSLLIYDEAQFHEEFKPARGISRYKQVEDLTIHRKTGHEIWFITQDPKRLHNDILAMVEQHYHLERPYGAKLASIYQYRGAERNPSAKTVKERAENKRLFNYDRRLFELYESSQVQDGIKLRLPKELTVWIVLAIIVGAYGYSQITSDGTQRYLNMAKGEHTAEGQANDISSNAPVQSQATDQPNAPIPIDPAIYEQTRVSMVIASSTSCKATNSLGEDLQLDYDDCMSYNKDVTKFKQAMIKPPHFMLDGSANKPIYEPKITNPATQISTQIMSSGGNHGNL